MKRIFGIIFGLFLSTAALAQYETPAVNSPLFPSTPSAGQVPIASSPSAADWKTMSGDAALASNGALTLGTVNGNVGTFGSATQCVTVTTNAKGLITAASSTACLPSGIIGTALGGTGVDNSTNTANDVLASNGTNGGFLHTALTSLITTVCKVSPTTCTSVFGYASASWWNVKCDGSTDDGPAFNTALAAINYAQLWVPATSAGCRIATRIFYNSYTSPGILTVPGIKLIGQGRIATALHAAVANGYVIAVNPEWAAAHKAEFLAAPVTSGGTLGASVPIATLGAITPGSAYTNGTYSGVSLTGGSGSGATANITVAGGAVTVVTLVNPGTGYAIGNTLSATAASIGGTGSGFSIPVATATYYIQLTMNDGLGHEIRVGIPRSYSVTTAVSSISVPFGVCSPGYTFNIYFDTASTPAHYATVSGGNAISVACNQTVVITSIGGAQAFPTANQAVWQESELRNITIDNPAATANASAVLWFQVGYSTMEHVYFKGLTTNGVVMINFTGDTDGWFAATFNDVKWDTITGWCLMGAGYTLENSNLNIHDSSFNLCGTSPANFFTLASISSITNANPGVVTTASLGWQSGDQLWIQSVAGMSLPNGPYRTCGSVTTSSFSLCDLNGNNVSTLGLGAFVSGLVELTFRPPQMQANGNGPTQSGAIAYTGLISSFYNNGFTQNKNTNFYFSEAGSNDNVTLVANDMENTYGVGLYAPSVVNLSWANGECLSTSSIGPTTICFLFGSGLGFGGAQNVSISGIKIRSDVGAASIGFEQLFGGGGLIYQNTFSFPQPVAWQTFTGTKYIGFQGLQSPIFWARFDGKTGATCTLKDSYNITSCSRTAPGNYTLAFTTPMSDANYALTGSGTNVGVNSGLAYFFATPTVNNFQVACIVPSTLASQDCDIMSVTGSGNPF